jgi:hypothetical protein
VRTTGHHTDTLVITDHRTPHDSAAAKHGSVKIKAPPATRCQAIGRRARRELECLRPALDVR